MCGDLPWRFPLLDQTYATHKHFTSPATIPWKHLEQGRAITVSEQVLERLASTLQLDAEERRHLLRLARMKVPVAGVSVAKRQ
jgi:hypothetical protein